MNLIKEKWTNDDIAVFLEYLKTFSKGEEKAVWEQRIVNTSLPCLALPSTEIDKIAKQIFKGNYISFLDLWIWKNHSTTLVFGKILNKIKDFEILKKYLIPYSEKADNWSTIDCLKFHFTKENTADFIQISKTLIKSKYTFSRRLALIVLLKLLSFEDCSDICFDMLNNLTNEKEYYVNMAGAWLLAECMTRFRDNTIEYYKNNKTNDFIINKSISKCRDSFRISREDKDFLLKFKKNNK
jgi:3-methyladenine DNA glycosylase AlkD